MAWVAITEADLLTRISGSELTAFRAAALAAGQADPVAEVIDQVANMVRGYIAGCATNTLGDAGTIPDGLMGAALDLLVIECEKRAAGIILDPTGAREKAADRATRLLEQVAECKFAVEDPDTGETAAGQVEVANYEERQASRESLDGL